MVTPASPSSMFNWDPFINASAKQLAPGHYKTDGVSHSPGQPRISYVAKDDPEHVSLLLLCPEFWDYGHAPQHPIYAVLEVEPKILCILIRQVLH